MTSADGRVHRVTGLFTEGNISLDGGGRIEVPCCDVFVIEEGKIALFRCYNLASVLLAQLGVLDNLSAALVRTDVPVRQE